MNIVVPYQSSGQEIGETRKEMTKGLMKTVEGIINKFKNREGKYYLLVHAKPMHNDRRVIRIKPIALAFKPRMMLSCLCFGIDNETGTLTLEWALPGDWPTWSVGGTNEPVPEVLASINNSGIKYHYEDFLPE